MRIEDSLTVLYNTRAKIAISSLLEQQFESLTEKNAWDFSIDLVQRLNSNNEKSWTGYVTNWEDLVSLSR